VPIKWNPLRVIEAMDVTEGFVNEAIGPLQNAHAVVAEALKIDNLPDYVSQHLRRLESEIERVIGGTRPWGNGEWFEGNIRAEIKRTRESLPAERIEEARTQEEHGVMPALL